MARFVGPTVLSTRAPIPHQVGAQLLVTAATLAESEVDCQLDDAAAVAARVDALVSDYDDYYQLWRLECDGVINHDLVLSPDEGGLLFVTGSTEVAAVRTWDSWECADDVLAGQLEQAFADVLASERARMAQEIAQQPPAEANPVSAAPAEPSGFSFVRLPGLGARAGLAPVDQRRAALFWRFEGGEQGDLDGFDAWLEAGELTRHEVRGPDGQVQAVWWGLDDHGLLFGAGSAQLIGEAIQHGFVCRDVPLWRGIAAADGQPGLISWELGPSVGASGDQLWIKPPDPELLWQALFGTGS